MPSKVSTRSSTSAGSRARATSGTSTWRSTSTAPTRCSRRRASTGYRGWSTRAAITPWASRARVTTTPCRTTSIPGPTRLYGVSKAASESLCSLYWDRYGIHSICLRIGSYRERPTDKRALLTWLSPDGLHEARRGVPPGARPRVSRGVGDLCQHSPSGVARRGPRDWLRTPRRRRDVRERAVGAAAQRGDRSHRRPLRRQGPHLAPLYARTAT